MRIPSPYPWLIGFLLLSALGWVSYQHHPLFPPAPTGGILTDGTKSDKRERWIELMHRTAPGTDWRKVEAQTRLLRRQTPIFENRRSSPCEVEESFAAGRLFGRWIERGSNNQTGSIIEVTYAPAEDRIWLISAGGTLWSSTRKQVEWQVENQYWQLDRGFLEWIAGNGTNGRLLAFSEQIPHYSDDRGQNWERASGFSGLDPTFDSPVLLADQSVFLLWKPAYYEPFAIYRSDDRGRSYKKLAVLDTYESSRLALYQPQHSSNLLLARKKENGQLRLQEWNFQQEVLVEISAEKALELGKAPANLMGRVDSTGLLHLYTYTEKEGNYYLYHSSDKGKQWEKLSQLPHTPWAVGLYLSPSKEGVLYMGEIEAHRSVDGGRSWESINHWWEYYDNIEGALHADIMCIEEFRPEEGKPFTLIGHHGGISMSYDQFESQKNIGLTHLNTSQYYSVRTDPNDPDFVYAGSQDQGFQRSVGFTLQPDMTAAFEQVISGDYGSIVFGRAGTALWTVYPGGWINYYDEPRAGQVSASFELKSKDEPVWLPPLMPNPDSEKNGIYMAGGNLDGGPGSYLIGLEYKNKKLATHQLNYDFQLESAGGALSALASSRPNHLYTATTNGRFFYSHDGGANWEQNVNFIPEGHYLYGQAIYVSKHDPLTVLLAGSGYNNPPVYISRDGGQSFHDMAEGLPPTLVLGLSATPKEDLYFAATEAGPFVYVVADRRWYDLNTPCMPAQTYWSVEYVPSSQTVRFGTYGRGIWDLQLKGNDPTPTTEPDREPVQLNVFPNPSTGPIRIALEGPAAAYELMLYDASGRLLLRRTGNSAPVDLTLQLNDLSSGIYLLRLEMQDQTLTKRLILRR